VSAAALFVAKTLTQVVDGTRIVAILPEALRTGSRYSHWRRHIESLATVRRVEALGRFDRLTDIHVFILSLDRRAGGPPTIDATPRWRDEDDGSPETVGDFFEVWTGPVVQNRDPHRGPWHRFAHVRSVPPWERINAGQHLGSRRYAGRVFDPPFVVLRRTSRPEDQCRTVASIVTGSSPVAVENHLLVLVPQDRTEKRCHQALSVLRAPGTTDWMNKRIRCRHLTVGAVSSIPWSR
jgi:hypothetical protein